MKQLKKLTIGRLAKLIGVNVESIRYYERTGLIKQPNDYSGKYRIYSEEYIDQIHFIKKAQTLGFSLKEIKDLLFVNSNSDFDCQNVKELTEKKILEIDEKIKILKKMKNILKDLNSKCKGRKMNITDCPIIFSIKQPS